VPRRGPGACVVVAKAADQPLDVYQLCMSLATHVPTTSRAQFLDGAGDVLPGADPRGAGSGARRLAEPIGLVARVLVDRESRAAVSPAELYARLAQDISDFVARLAFVAAAPRWHGAMLAILPI
jgi:hypothetical protein